MNYNLKWFIINIISSISNFNFNIFDLNNLDINYLILKNFYIMNPCVKLSY